MVFLFGVKIADSTVSQRDGFKMLTKLINLISFFINPYFAVIAISAAQPGDGVHIQQGELVCHPVP